MKSDFAITSIRVRLESPSQPDVISLIAELDVYQRALYPPEACYTLDLTTLEPERVILAVARESSGTTMGCGAVVLNNEAGELKRMYVRPQYRGRGVATAVLATLEAAAFKHGCQLIQLETGPYQPEALAFYGKHGYVVCGAFGNYPEHPLSIFMEKVLDNPARTPTVSV